MAEDTADDRVLRNIYEVLCSIPSMGERGISTSLPKKQSRAGKKNNCLEAGRLL